MTIDLVNNTAEDRLFYCRANDPKNWSLLNEELIEIKSYLLNPEPKPVEYARRRLLTDRYSISSGVWSIKDIPSSASSTMT